ncbi:MAG: CPBP family intramembrane metalloprotease [Rhodococcus sp.]|nr:CPBP family intramembrane metalloprotease [Rhodococcus sp. (in: high G+C Gram-positive bacteria)]
MSARLQQWLHPQTPEQPALSATERRGLWIEITIVLLITFGFNGLSSLLGLIDSLLQQGTLAEQTVALNVPRATNSFIDLARQILGVVKLLSWGALGLYLLWRSGIGPKAIGLSRRLTRTDATHGAGFAVLIGVPGLAFYLATHAIGANLTVAPSILNDHWWRIPALVAWSIANSGAEEIIVVAYLITRLRQLGWSENSSLLASALLRGAYHLYQGFGGGIGNVVMGVVFARYWQKTNRLWPLIVAHALIDIVAFVGYALLRDRISWIP